MSSVFVHQGRDPRTWYTLGIWRKRAKHQLKSDPLCRLCTLDGKTSIATIADHIEPHKGDWNKFVLGALQSLCSNCHESRKKIIEARGYDTTIGKDGYPLDRRHPVYR